MTTPGARLKRTREANGFLTAKDAALAMGVPIATYGQHERAPRHLPARRAAEYARFFSVTPEYLLYGREEALGDVVPILDAHGKDTGRTVFMPPSPSSITFAQALTERDGIAYSGFVALYDQPQNKAGPALDGHLCIAAILEGNEEQRYLVRATHAGNGNFHLYSQGLVQPKVDQSVLWIAPVTAFLPIERVTA